MNRGQPHGIAARLLDLIGHAIETTASLAYGPSSAPVEHCDSLKAMVLRFRLRVIFFLTRHTSFISRAQATVGSCLNNRLRQAGHTGLGGCPLLMMQGNVIPQFAGCGLECGDRRRPSVGIAQCRQRGHSAHRCLVMCPHLQKSATACRNSFAMPRWQKPVETGVLVMACGWTMMIGRSL